MARKKWTAAEKLAILKEAEQNGVTVTIRKHDIHYGTFYAWKQKHELEGEAGLTPGGKPADPELKRLQLENLRLKQLIADKELALMVKDELLKKSLQTGKTK
jgi:putative transposase